MSAVATTVPHVLSALALDELFQHEAHLQLHFLGAAELKHVRAFDLASARVHQHVDQQSNDGEARVHHDGHASVLGRVHQLHNDQAQTDPCENAVGYLRK